MSPVDVRIRNRRQGGDMMRNLPFFIQRLRIANGEGSLFGVAWGMPWLSDK